MSRVFTALVFVGASLVMSQGLARGQPAPVAGRFPSLSHEEAWRRLGHGGAVREDTPLPAWVRILAQPLPKATAAFVKLDHLHRAENPLGPLLAGKLRWVAADAVGCDYARRTAEGDLRRGGLSDEGLAQFVAGASQLPPSERAALAFARQLTVAGHETSDEQVAELVEHFGPDKVVGIVHTVAFANFQNRLFLALGIEIEPDGPLPPLQLADSRQTQQDVAVPHRRSWEELSKAAGSGKPRSVDWGHKDFEALEQALRKQERRSPRIPLPDPERLDHLPAEVRERTRRIIWSNVSMGYQPELTGGWFGMMQTFRDESQLDRVFANSMFWVVTRSNECFY